MANVDSIYRRLTGRKRSLAGYSQLWLAPDHILLLRSTYLVEEYQRFAIGEIQAIVVTERSDRSVAQVASAAAAIAWTLLALAVTSIFAKGFFLVTGALALALVIADISRGPRCRCYLHTAVSRELLTPVARLGKARRFLAEIQPAIEAVQGQFQSASLPMLETTAQDQPPAVPDAPGYLPEILFALLLVDAVFAVIDTRYPSLGLSVVLLNTFSTEILLAVFALIRRRARDPRRLIYVIMAVAIVGIGWDLVGIGRGLFAWMGQIGVAARHGVAVRPTFTWASSLRVAYIAAAWRVILGFAGLIAAFFERRTELPK